MKNLKLLASVAIPLVVFGSAPQAAAFVTNFDSYATAPLPGQPGWTGSTSAANYAEVDSGYIDSSNQLVLGFADGTQPTETTVTVGNSGYSEFLAGTQAVFDFRIIDQIGTNVAADIYGFTLTSGGNTLSIYLYPTTSGSRPAGPPDPDLGVPVARWELGYSLSGIGGYTKFGSDINVFESNIWNLSITASANSGDFSLSDFSVVLNGATAGLTGVAMNPDAAVDGFGFSWDKSGAAFTDNYIAIDNLSVVPEPSSALLLGLAGLGLMARRRRA